jgi:hypothetical protein
MVLTLDAEASSGDSRALLAVLKYSLIQNVCRSCFDMASTGQNLSVELLVVIQRADIVAEYAVPALNLMDRGYQRYYTLP